MTRSIGRKVTARRFGRLRAGLLDSTMLRAAALAGIAATPLMLPGPAQAAEWLGLTGNFNLGSNWSGGIVPADTATFTNSGTAERNVAVTSNTPLTLIDYDVDALDYTITMNTGRLLVVADITNNSAVEQSLVAGASSGLLITGMVSGAVALRAQSGGAIEFDAGSSAADARLIGSGGTFYLFGFAGETLSVGSIEGSGLIVSPGFLTLAVGSLNSDTTYTGVIDGAITLTKIGTGTLTFSGTNTYTSGTAINGGAISIGADANLGATTGSLSFDGGTLVIRSTLALADARDITLNDGGGTFDTNGFGLTVSTGITGTGGLTKTGTGTLTLSGASTYTGGTSISGGTLALSGAGALAATGAVDVDASGAVFSIAAASGNRTIGGLSGVAGSLVLLGANDLTAGAAANTGFAGVISGSGSFIKAGAGTLTLTGANVYVGGTVVTDGILEVSGTGSITHTSGTTALSGGQLSILSGADVTNFNGFIANVVGGIAEVLVDGAGSTWTNNGDLRVGFGGTGTLTISDGGTLASGGSFAIIGDAATAVGTMTVTGTDSLWTVNNSNLIVGNDGTGTLTVSAAATVTVDGSTGVGSGTDGTGGGTLTVTGAASSLTTNGIFVGLDDATGSVSVLAGATLLSEDRTVPSSLLGITNIGANGTAIVSGTNSLWSSESFFQVDGSLTVADGGEVSVGVDGLRRITLSPTLAGGVLNIGAAVGDTAVAPGTVEADVRSVFAGTLNFNHTDTNYTFLPVISGEITVHAVAGTTSLLGANTYSGGTIISGGTLRAGNASAFGTSSVNMASAAARLLIYGIDVGIAGLDGVTGAEVDFGTSGYSVLSLTGASGSFSFAGNIVGSSPQAADLVKDGVSRQTLSGNNTFYGTATVNGGTLVLGSDVALSENAFLSVAVGAQVTVDGFDVAIAELVTLGAGADGTVFLDGGSLAAASDEGGFNSFDGIITGTGGFIVNGPSLTQTLTGFSDYTGGTTIANGTLALAGTGVLATTGAVDLTSATAVFDMSGVTGDRTIGDLSGVSGSSVIIGAHGLTVGTANDTAFDGVISGTGGTFTKAGGGILTLGGANSFTGLTTISGGAVQADGSLAGALTAQSGTTLGGTGTIAGAVTIQDGATLAPGASPGTLTVGSLVQSSGSILDFELGEAGVAGGSRNDLVAVTTDLTLAGELNISESAGGTFGLGTYTLFTYGGALTQSPLTFGSAPIGYNVGNFTLDTGIAGTVNLIVAAATTDQYWIGGPGTWNAVNTNWTDESGGIASTWGGQTGIFRGTAGIVTVAGAQSFNALRFESDGYLLEGDALAIAGAQGDVRVDTGYTATIGNVISGTGLLAKGGSGTLLLTGANTYEGGTLIAGGVLAIVEDGNLGDAAGGVTLDGGTLQLAGLGDIATTRAFTIGAGGGRIDTGPFIYALTQISGPGVLFKTGTGILDINGTANLAGGVALLDGVLDIHLGSGSTFTGDIDGVFGTEVGLLANAADGVYAGVISGGTGLYVGGAGTVTLSGINTFTDYTIVDTGATLALTGAGSIAASDHLDLYGTLDISGTSNGASIQSLGFNGNVLLGTQTLTLTNAAGLFEGTISGTGGVTLLAGVQGFAGTSTYSGATNVAVDSFFIALTPNALSSASAFTVDGVLGVGADQTIGSLAGSGFVGLNDPLILEPVELTVGGNGTSTTFSGALVGEGTLIKTGAGTFTLTGDLSGFEGGFAVMGGDLAINTVFGGTVGVLSGGTLQGSGTVGAVDIAAGATVAPGNSIGTLTVTGDASFSAGAVYQVEIDPTGASDLLAVGGVATLGGATVEVLKATGSFTAGARYTILTAAGGISGTFGTLAQDMPFLDLSLAYDLTDVYLDIARNEVTFPSVGNTPNERAVGGAVESLGAGNPVYDSVVMLTSVEAARAAFNSLSGEIGASAKGVLINDSQFVRNAVFERLVTAGSATPSGMAVAPLGYAAPAKPASNTPYPTKAAPVAMAAPASAIWAQGFGSWGSTDGNGNAASIDRDTGGFFIGADTLVGDWRLGVLGGYSQTSFDVDGRASSGESDNIHAGLYAGTNWGAINFRSGASYSWNDISTSRNVGIPTPQLLEADYDAGTAQVFGELGYGLTFGAVDFEPFGGLAYVNLHTDGFTETGGAAALTSSSDSTDATYTTLGLRASTTFDTGAFTTTLRGMLGWRHAFGDITPTTAYQFAAGGSPFTVSGLPIAEDALVMDVGLDMALTDTASLGVFYSAQFGDSAQGQSVRGTLNWKF